VKGSLAGWMAVIFSWLAESLLESKIFLIEIFDTPHIESLKCTDALYIV
jgi:hypothetical protein